MATYAAIGIVIGRTNFGEADRIVRFLTPGQGKISAVAKGVRKIKSRSGGHLELFGEVQLMLAEGRNLPVVTSARLTYYPHQLSARYETLQLAFLVGRMIDRLIEEHQPQPEAYALLGETVRELDGGAGGPLVELWFKLRLLQVLGYRPELGACVTCGGQDPDGTYFFSPERGGIVDEPCRGAADRPMSREAIKLWRLLSDQSYAVVARVEGAAALATDSIASCDEFYEYHLGRAFTING